MNCDVGLVEFQRPQIPALQRTGQWGGSRTDPQQTAGALPQPPKGLGSDNLDVLGT